MKFSQLIICWIISMVISWIILIDNVDFPLKSRTWVETISHEYVSEDGEKVWCEEGRVRCGDEKATRTNITTSQSQYCIKRKGKKYCRHGGREISLGIYVASDGEIYRCGEVGSICRDEKEEKEEIDIQGPPYYTIYEGKKYIYTPIEKTHKDWDWETPIYLKEPYTELRLIVVIILNGILLVYTLGNENFRKIFK